MTNHPPTPDFIVYSDTYEACFYSYHPLISFREPLCIMNFFQPLMISSAQLPSPRNLGGLSPVIKRPLY